MNDVQTAQHDAEVSDADRLLWIAPKVVTMAAGKAENGVGGQSDDGINNS